MGAIYNYQPRSKWFAGIVFIEKARSIFSQVQKAEPPSAMDIAKMVEVRLNIIRGLRSLFLLPADPSADSCEFYTYGTMIEPLKKFLEPDLFKRLYDIADAKMEISIGAGPYHVGLYKLRSSKTGKEALRTVWKEKDSLHKRCFKERVQHCEAMFKVAEEVFFSVYLADKRNELDIGEIFNEDWDCMVESLMEGGEAKDEDEAERILGPLYHGVEVDDEYNDIRKSIMENLEINHLDVLQNMIHSDFFCNGADESETIFYGFGD